MSNLRFATRLNREPDDQDTATCAGCGREVDLHCDDYNTIDDEVYCEECSGPITKCMRCGAEIFAGDAKGIKEDEELCEYCYDDLYVTI